MNVRTCRCSWRRPALRAAAGSWRCCGARQTPGLQQAPVQDGPGRAEGRAASRQVAGLGARCLMGVLPATSLQSRVLCLGETIVLACPSGMLLSSQMSDSGEVPQ